MKYDDKNSIGGRMKNNYENVFKYRLPERMPVIIRLDGRAFHTLTKRFKKPFDKNFIFFMNETARYLCKEIQGVQLAYIQSDEISLLLHNYKKLDSQSWFNNEIQKMCSISAGIASSVFTVLLSDFEYAKHNQYNTWIIPQQFDSRCFVLPEAEVVNYFIWRQKDWERNSIQMLAQSLYSHKELKNKNNLELQDMCWQKDKDWEDLDVDLLRGRCIRKLYETQISETDTVPEVWSLDNNIPIFAEHRDYIERYLKVEEE